MCIKIINSHEEIPYDIDRPLEDQIVNAKEIIINYQPQDPKLERFTNEVERICQNGINCNLNIHVKTNNILKGAKYKRKTNALEVQLKLNDIVKLMATSHKQADKKLEELANMCLERQTG